MGIIKRRARYDVVDHESPPDPASDTYLDYLNREDAVEPRLGLDIAESDPSAWHTPPSFHQLQGGSLQTGVLHSDDDLQSIGFQNNWGQYTLSTRGGNFYPVNDIIDADEATLTVYSDPPPATFGDPDLIYVAPAVDRQMILEVAGQKYRIRQYTVNYEER